MGDTCWVCCRLASVLRDRGLTLAGRCCGEEPGVLIPVKEVGDAEEATLPGEEPAGTSHGQPRGLPWPHLWHRPCSVLLPLLHPPGGACPVCSANQH